MIKRDLLNELEFDKIFYGYGEYFFRLLYFSKNKNLELLWFHAASLGEVKSIFPIINKLDNPLWEFEYEISQ